MSNNKTTLVDGEWLDVIPADDRGFLFGDHVFETMQCVGRSIPLWSLHQSRLEASAHTLGIELPAWNQLACDIEKLMALGPGIIRLTLSRGSSSSGYWIPEGIKTRRILQWRPLPTDLSDLRTHGLSVCTAEVYLTQADGLDWGGLKHGNRLLQVMAASRCQKGGHQEALIYRSDGYLAEAIASSVILIKDHQFLTPKHPDVASVGLVWLRGKGIDIRAENMTRQDVEQADEIVLMNAAVGPRGVTTLDGVEKPLGEGCQRLLSLWSRVLL